MTTNTISKKEIIETNNFFIGRDYKRRQVQIPGKILLGKISPKFRYRYIVSLTHSSGQHWCGGTIIAPDVVLSAAHCANSIERGFAEVSRYDRSDFEEPYESFQILNVVRHPQYDRSRKPEFDYMLIKLNGKSSAPLVTLNEDSNIPSSNGDLLTVMGWGATGEGDTGVNKLNEVEIKYVTNDVCEESRGTYTYQDWETKEWKTFYFNYKGLINDYDMCAIDINDEGFVEDSCYGDSGGPLIIRGNDQSEDIQVGIVSWGVQCGNINFPGVYARVSHQIQWIKQTTCDLSIYNPQQYNPLSFRCDPNPTISPTPAPTINQEYLKFLTFQIQLDEYPNEVGWQLFKLTSEREVLQEESPIGRYTNRNFKFVTELISVDPGKTYRFSILDSFGDGVAIFGPNTFLYQGPKEGGYLIKSWAGNWGRYQEVTFSVPESKDVQFEKNHQITLRIKLDNRPRDIYWEIRSKDGSKLFASSGEQKYTKKGEIITEEIHLEAGRSYKLLIKDLGQNGINVKGPNVILYEGKIGIGRVIFKDWANWGSQTEKIFWLRNFPLESRFIGEKCGRNFECKSGHCKFGRCKERPECADFDEEIYINKEYKKQNCSFLLKNMKFCLWRRIKDLCPVTCGACHEIGE